MIESYNEKQLEEKIDKYVNGELSPRETDELWAELIQDGYHLDYMKSVANVKAVIEKKKEERQIQKRRKKWFYAAAAIVIFLVGVVGYMNIYNQNNTRSLEPISSIELDYYRSEDGNMAQDDSKVIRDAIRLANTGAVTEAINLLDSELEKASKPSWIAELSLNLGSLYYNEGNYRESINHYERVIEHKEKVDLLMLEKAYWYVGNAYFHIDQLVKARTHIEKAYDLNGAYRRVSKSYLDALSD
ncbi:tetratricopeptide repeat protein [Fodinibius saliphilus]|uniref:tetratricopeptide repeat protein n=1 Tax=Fodinibius saliphilus TaxID=1920650 RepID=UPI001109BECC|nr:tetratricopeptide repeat protein [Fodinibius saliphilus]